MKRRNNLSSQRVVLQAKLKIVSFTFPNSDVVVFTIDFSIATQEMNRRKEEKNR